MKIQEIENAVVVPWDYSDLSHDALRRASEMVGDNSKILVVHVSHVPSPYEYGVVWDEVSEDTMREQLAESYQKQIASDDQLQDISFSVLFGDPGHKVCDFAEDNKADLVILPSHGRSGFKRLLLGSVAERVVRFAPCPVLVLRTAPS